MKLIAQGAEAKLFRNNNILIKDRIPKSYRIQEIDVQLRRHRTKVESHILQKLGKLGLAVPKLIDTDETQKISMDFIKGDKVSEILDAKNVSKLCKEIGQKLRVMHDNHIIHGDLTTSNMILEKEIYFVDFGLSYESQKIEDMAVDLHLFRQTLESKHNTVYEKGFKAFLSGYGNKDVIDRLGIVEKRGRYKRKNH
tara:strand:+ start:1618 stop:2205 length:588 start_codon:yes stop_codon:yes gene_type:complete